MGIEKAHFVAHHAGATIAVEFASAYPERVNKLILSGVSLYTMEEQKEFVNNPAFAPMQIAKDGKFILSTWKILSGVSPYIPVQNVYRMYRENMQAGPRMHDVHHAAFLYDKASRLPLVESPTLLVCGNEDMFFKKFNEVARLIPNCKTHVFHNANAMALERPSEFARVIIDFLATSM